jgi:hypothetical protein
MSSRVIRDDETASLLRKREALNCLKGKPGVNWYCHMINELDFAASGHSDFWFSRL